MKGFEHTRAYNSYTVVPPSALNPKFIIPIQNIEMIHWLEYFQIAKNRARFIDDEWR